MTISQRPRIGKKQGKMKFSLWTNYGALNSKPIFDAFAHSVVDSGHDVSWNDPNSDVDVIWSVLWNGRMASNKNIWDRNKVSNKPTIVLEVGGIQRGTTWKVGLNGINRGAFFNCSNNDDSRKRLLGLEVKPWRNDGEYILICGQHDKSQQWVGMPSLDQWFTNTVTEIRKHSKRPILIRPHPRCPAARGIEKKFDNIYRQDPIKLTFTYDDFDMGFNNVYATVSYSSNPGIQSIIKGIPAFVGTLSLAYDVGNNIDSLHNIEQPLTPDRTQWINDYAHTEYTVEEIANGIPLKNLTSELN